MNAPDSLRCRSKVDWRVYNRAGEDNDAEKNMWTKHDLPAVLQWSAAPLTEAMEFLTSPEVRRRLHWAEVYGTVNALPFAVGAEMKGTMESSCEKSEQNASGGLPSGTSFSLGWCPARFDPSSKIDTSEETWGCLVNGVFGVPAASDMGRTKVDVRSCSSVEEGLDHMVLVMATPAAPKGSESPWDAPPSNITGFGEISQIR